jgi:hypothetical protein
MADGIGIKGWKFKLGYCRKSMKAFQQNKRMLKPKAPQLTPEQQQELKDEASDCQAKYAAELVANPGLPALAAHEIYEIYGSPMLILHPPTKTM